ncbi:2-oxo-4-hydroxy-4-carboxy-5-ureidoimidazoline decarboxylase [Chitinophaga ginsengisoli]|uniref:2-oxo-4-hydroxy-4-carboxy-5-ureidoimidazoline decarboxylase n=1 Tax=Chitinophaga ginsengisoli TaxID=363837 RepID=A0A2P8FUP2_9BACT|nr:2-oxo-4-hydroxy-4-carboxy-5-ureidoimidazoline decarboxylase [Chitinophaga ginsengisoli]PSL25431.1 2-oxo-4-hydroxy-4-carboxy-5-ureidoimidazoline decarboxylase [Chitinophaga ginsengisoli]
MTLTALNALPPEQLNETLSTCCGATAWIEKMKKEFPVKDEATLLAAAAKHWHECTEQDWREAFSHHPKIGDLHSLQQKFATTAQWASREQAGTIDASTVILQAFAKGNKLYEDKFGYIFIVCATGKSAPEMLSILTERLKNSPEEEIKIAMQEQEKITAIRLKKLLSA